MATKTAPKATVKTTKTSRAKATPAKAAPKATVVTEAAVVAGPTVKKVELIDRIVERSGLKKKDVKPVVEAALAELGEAIAKGEELNLPPFGKLKVNRSKELAGANVYICKVRRPKSGDAPGAEPLVAAAE